MPRLSRRRGCAAGMRIALLALLTIGPTLLTLSTLSTLLTLSTLSMLSTVSTVSTASTVSAVSTVATKNSKNVFWEVLGTPGDHFEDLEMHFGCQTWIYPKKGVLELGNHRNYPK